jgi:hypothetical protein
MSFLRHTWILTVAALLFIACQSNHDVACGALYEHLLETGGATSDPERRTRFITTCNATWDERRHACMMRATTVSETLECRPQRVRPE